jgi:glycosyltransferase involved in cell wall biosynthesis
MSLGLPAPKISVLLSVYNGERYLRESVDSVLAQSESDFELLVVDDGSIDGSRDIMASYRDARIRMIATNGRSGLYPNLNLMAQHARSDLLKPWAQDDAMEPDCLRHAVEFFAARPQLVLFYCNMKQRWDDGPVVQPERDEHTPEVLDPATADWFLLLHGSLCGNVSTLFLPKLGFEAIGGFENHISADFGAMVAAAGKGAVGHMPSADVVVRHHSRQWSRDSDSGLRTLVANSVLYGTLLRRWRERPGDNRSKVAIRVLAELLGRNATPNLLRGVLRGHFVAAYRAWRAIAPYASPFQLAWFFARRLAGYPRWIP